MNTCLPLSAWEHRGSSFVTGIKESSVPSPSQGYSSAAGSGRPWPCGKSLLPFLALHCQELQDILRDCLCIHSMFSSGNTGMCHWLIFLHVTEPYASHTHQIFIKGHGKVFHIYNDVSWCLCISPL